MAKITQTAIALIITFCVVGLFMNSLYTISTDTTKKNFSIYEEYDNKTMTILTENNATYTNENSTVLNLRNAAQNIETNIAEQQRNFQSTLSGAEKLLNAFGLTASLILNVLILFFAVIVEGVNFVFAIGSMITQLPPPWGGFLGDLSVLGISLITVYLVFKLVSAYIKWDL